MLDIQIKVYLYKNPLEKCPIMHKSLLNINKMCINYFKVILLYCWLGKQKGLFLAQCPCGSPKFNPTLHSDVRKEMVANHGVLYNIQQAMGYIANIWAKNSKEDKNLITEINKINKLKTFEVNNKFVIRIYEKTESIRAKTDGGRCKVIKVECFENENNSSIYQEN